MRRVAPRGWEPIVSVYRDFWRVVASSVRPTAGARLALLALCGAGLAGGAGLALAQGLSDRDIRCMQLQQDLAAARGGGAQSRRRRPHRSADRPGRPRVPGHPRGHGRCRLLRELLHLRPRPGAQPEMPQHERPRRGRAPPAHPAPAAAPGAHRRRRQSAAAGRVAGCARPQRLRRPAPCAEAPRRRLVRLLRRRPRGTRGRSADAGLSQHRSERPVSLRLRAAVRRLLLSDPLLDLRQPARAGSAIVPVELRGAGRALCLSEPGPGDRAGRVAERLGLYGPPRRAAFQEGICEGLLLQAGRIQSDRDRSRQ